ncbi:MAG: type toxin-antitoxin system prevent-host-death family antitoxin [Nevskia sp.]|nr:type toxin-antitoxin system prevent-host-death family antitoxin [Nevskia sp.]
MQVNMHEAKTQLSALAERARKGERVIIAKAGEPFVELIAVREERPKIKLGTLKGKIQIHGDFADLDEEIARSFNESHLHKP